MSFPSRLMYHLAEANASEDYADPELDLRKKKAAKRRLDKADLKRERLNKKVIKKQREIEKSKYSVSLPRTNGVVDTIAAVNGENGENENGRRRVEIVINNPYRQRVNIEDEEAERYFAGIRQQRNVVNRGVEHNTETWNFAGNRRLLDNILKDRAEANEREHQQREYNEDGVVQRRVRREYRIRTDDDDVSKEESVHMGVGDIDRSRRRFLKLIKSGKNIPHGGDDEYQQELKELNDHYLNNADGKFENENGRQVLNVVALANYKKARKIIDKRVKQRYKFAKKFNASIERIEKRAKKDYQPVVEQVKTLVGGESDKESEDEGWQELMKPVFKPLSPSSRKRNKRVHAANQRRKKAREFFEKKRIEREGDQKTKIKKEKDRYEISRRDTIVPRNEFLGIQVARMKEAKHLNHLFGSDDEENLNKAEHELIYGLDFLPEKQDYNRKRKKVFSWYKPPHQYHDEIL